MKNESLKYGEIYNFKVGDIRREVIYIGVNPDRRKIYCHTILMWGKNRPIIYRFAYYELKGLDLDVLHFVQENLTNTEREFAEELLQRKGF